MVKYEMVILGKVVRTIYTDSVNREVVLCNMIKKAEGLPFRILLTKDKNIRLLLDSKKDKLFINFLTENNCING